MADVYEPAPAALLSVQPVIEPDGELWLDADELELVAPELVVHGDDGEVWGVNAERVAVALWALVRTLHEQLELERRRSGQLDRRTRWLYKAVTGHELPESKDEAS